VLVNTLDVIRISDEQIKPPGPKWVVCVEPTIGIFLHINSDGWRDGSISISQEDHNKFLRWDSHIECGASLDLDEYTIRKAIEGKKFIPKIHHKHAREICQAVLDSKNYSPKDKRAICEALAKAEKDASAQ